MTVTLPDFQATRPVTVRIAGDAPTVLWRVDLAHPACDRTPVAPLAPRLSPAALPTATSADLLPDLPTTQAHVLMASDFEHAWTVAEEQAVQEMGLPLPAVVTTTLNLFELVAAPARARGADGQRRNPAVGSRSTARPSTVASPKAPKTARANWSLWPVIHACAGGWTYPTPSATRRQRRRQGCEWPPGRPRLAGRPHCRVGDSVQFACVFDDLTATRNLLIQFALNLAAAGPESSLFVGVATDGQTFHGRRWVAPPTAPEGDLAWTEQRLFAPLLELGAAQRNRPGCSVVRVSHG